MTFFDRKEEVIDIELTQYGKHLLSTGKFKPAYYQFFDDDIIYDIQYAGQQDELQKDIQERIKESPRVHTQYNFVGLERELKKTVEQVRNKREGNFTNIYSSQPLKHNLMLYPLAKSEIGEQKVPAWNIKSLNTKFSDIKTFITGSFNSVKIPRITMQDVEFKIATLIDKNNDLYVPADKNDTISETPFKTTGDLNNLSTRFQDNSFVFVEENYILLDLQELNSQFEQENFEIELYEVTKNENEQEELKQLYFNKKQENVVNNLLVETEMQLTSYQPNKAEMVENYFIINSDREISSNILCRHLSDSEKQTLVAKGQLDLDCEELYGKLTDPRITSDVKPEDLVEIC